MALEEGAAIFAVGDVLTLDRCARLLAQTEEAQIARALQNGEAHMQKNSSLASKVTAMIAIARATESDPMLVDALLIMRAAVDPMVERMVLDPKTGQPKSVYNKSRRRTGPRHRRVIDQFQCEAADAVKSAFFRLPDKLMAPLMPRIRTGAALSRSEQVDAIVAVTCRILTECPMRRANLAGSLRISGDRQTLFLSPRSGWCFSTTLKARAEKVAGIKINPHAFRHVVGLLVLQEDPAQLPLVSSLLGHASLRTTSDWYAEVPQQQAHEAYLTKLSSVSAKATLAATRGRRVGK